MMRSRGAGSRRARLAGTWVVLAGAVFAMSACASVPSSTDSPTTAADAATAVPAVPLVVMPQTTPGPRSDCASVESAGPFGGCASYVSTGGHDDSGALPWLADTPLDVRFYYANASLTVVMGTPCNNLQAAVVLTGTQLIADPKHVVTTLMACMNVQGTQGDWTMKFLGLPMTYAVAGDSLTLTTSMGEVDFRRM